MGARRPEVIGFVGVRDHFVDVRWTGAVANLTHCDPRCDPYRQQLSQAVCERKILAHLA